MQKKLIALAVAGLVSAPVFAADNVTVYGVLDNYVQSSKAGGISQSGLTSDGMSGSRWGLKGTEDLGNGLKAVFTMEAGLDSDNGGENTTFNRQVYVGLQGGFGSVTAGRQYTPTFYLTAGVVDTNGYSNWSVVANGLGDRTRTSNSIVYTSPSFSGLTVRALYGFGEQVGAANKSNNNEYGLSGIYANGPISIGLAYHNQRQQNVSSGSNKWTTVGGAYDFGMAKLTAAYQRENTVDVTGANAVNLKAKNWTLGVSAPVGKAGTVAVQYAKANPDGAAWTKGWNLLYSHALSKRTNAYAGYATSSADTGNAPWTLGAINAAAAGFKTRTYFAGMRHTF